MKKIKIKSRKLFIFKPEKKKNNWGDTDPTTTMVTVTVTGTH